MEPISSDQFYDHDPALPGRPQFLKILCIISFVGCGLMLLCYCIGLLSFLVTGNMADKVWPQIVSAQPMLAKQNPVALFHKMGLLSVYGLIGNTMSLIGVIMMYRLNKTGFFIYSIAEIGLNFFRLNLGDNDPGAATGGLVLMIFLDAIFIALYAVNLKYMTGSRNELA